MSEAQDFAIWLKDHLRQRSCWSSQKIQSTMRMVKGLTLAAAARKYAAKYRNCADYEASGERCRCDITEVAFWLYQDGALTYKQSVDEPFERLIERFQGIGFVDIRPQKGAPSRSTDRGG